MEFPTPTEEIKINRAQTYILFDIYNSYDESNFQDLLEREQTNQDAIEKEKAKLAKFTEEKNNEILYYNNQLAQLQTRLDQAQSRAVKWESKWAHIQVCCCYMILL